MNSSAILCVDDDPFVLKLLLEQLKRHLGDSCYIEVAESSKQALEIAEKLYNEGIEINLIIFAQFMPGIKGDKLPIAFQTWHPKMLQIALTEQAITEVEIDGVNAANLYRYIAKPWDEIDLALTVKEALRRYTQERQLAKQNAVLKKLKASLERKFAKRTLELTAANTRLEQEIVDRNLLEEKLSFSERKIRAVFEAMTDIVLIVREEGAIEVVPTNPARSGQTDANLLNSTIEQFFREESGEVWFGKIRLALDEQQTIDFDYSLPLDNEEVWFAASISPLPNNSVIWVARNITERKQAEAAMQAAKAAAEAANRAKSTFLANMSHELRSPLNAILGFAQIMSLSQTLPSEHGENLGIVRRSAEHLLTVIDDVLDMAKIEAGRTTLNETNFDLHRLLNDLKQMFQLKAEDKGLELVFVSLDVPKYVRTDQVKLLQVLINLMTNAIKFTTSGTVSVRVRRGMGEWEVERREGFRATRCSLHFEVEDTGPGIDPDELDSVFEAFVQTKTGQQAQEGTGLGLPISRKFVQLMGGEITVSSEVGKGTTFKFDIKISQIEATEIEYKQATQRIIGLEPNQPRYRILIVDDKWDNRQLLVKLLSPLGFDIKEASNGKEAIEIWEYWEPHLIWMDMKMPVMDGYETTKRIKATAKGKTTAVIALTTSSFQEEEAIILEVGCDDFIRKPFREEDLFKTMNKHIGVLYVYEQLTHSPASTETDALILNSDVVAALPADWLVSLQQATIQCDLAMMLLLIDEIREQEDRIANALAYLANNFQFEELLNLIQSETG
ncbi:response regulator [Argonema antarcticum]|uniref:response regulator n=1 Tax=Argonema antarcticum TaxID=2942763 RepID=UPI002010CF89|nr:response regulator [Argonema antarcticum]MCL1471917.1 response regulator [Argonema antarcticum A004/B2]